MHGKCVEEESGAGIPHAGICAGSVGNGPLCENKWTAKPQ